MADTAKKAATKNSGAPRGGSLLLLGSVLWLVSWFVPVYKGQEIFGGVANAAQQLGASVDSAGASLDAPDWLPGWAACKLAWTLLTEQPKGETNPTGEEWKQRLAGSTCLTNLLMVVAIGCALMRRRSVVLGVLLIAGAGVNSSWIWLPEQNPFEWLRAGYFLWLVSFPLVGIGLCATARFVADPT